MSLSSSPSITSSTSPDPSSLESAKANNRSIGESLCASEGKGNSRIVENAIGVKTRARKINACLPCRWRKKRCDKVPGICGTCRRDGRKNPEIVCQWADNDKLPELKERVNSAQESFARGFNRDPVSHGDPVMNPLVLNDAVYEDDADDDLADIGIQLGKLRISDRIGGLVRPEMMNRGLDLSKHRYAINLPAGFPGSTPSVMSLLDPGPCYAAPSSALLFPGSPDASNECLSSLPDYTQATRLLNQYWYSVHRIGCVIHRPSFERRWQNFWTCVQNDQPVEVSLQAIVFAVLFSGLMSMSEDSIMHELGGSRSAWICTLHSSVGAALTRANWIRSTKLETLQAVVIYLIPLCRAEVSRAHSNFVAAAIRAAEGMGLYVDGTTRNYTPLQTHVRRLLWHQLGLLDIRTCEAIGPMPQMRHGEFGTLLPLNVDESAVASSSEDSRGWTDLTITIIRIKCNEFIRQIWTDRRLLQNKAVTITDILVKISAFSQQMENSYGRIINEEVAIQKYGRLLIDIQISRTYAMVLHQYHLHRQYQMSEPLMKVFIDMGIKTMTAVERFETDRDLIPWQWYAGAIQQHHYALAMAVELLLHPNRTQAPDILRGLDYVFEPPMSLQPLQRVRWIVETIRDRMKIYVQARRLRAPVAIMKDLQLSEGGDSAEESDSGAETNAAGAGPPMQPLMQHPNGHQLSTMGIEVSDVPLAPRCQNFNLVSSSMPPTSRMQPPELMDVDWTAMPSQFHDMIGQNINMNEMQWDVVSSTNAYDTGLSHFNHVPLEPASQKGYSYYAPAVAPLNRLQDDGFHLQSLRSQPQQHYTGFPATTYQARPMPTSTHAESATQAAYNVSLLNDARRSQDPLAMQSILHADIQQKAGASWQ